MSDFMKRLEAATVDEFMAAIRVWLAKRARREAEEREAAIVASAGADPALAAQIERDARNSWGAWRPPHLRAELARRDRDRA